MKAVRIHSFGGPDVLAIENLPKPQPREGEVLIKVEAASVNPVDYKIRAGEFKQGGKPPMTLGRDVSGIVEAVGGGVSEFKAGDEVYAFLDRDHGGYAEYTVAKIDGVAPKPQSIDHIHAAAVPLAATTAWQGLFDHGKLRAGERVLIHGAAGGVGHFAVQFAKDRGAYVIAVASHEDQAMLHRLGADEVIDYKTEKFEDAARDVDLVLDLVGGETQQRSWQVLKEGGRMVSTLQPPSESEAQRHHAHGENFMAQPKSDELVKIGQLIDSGRVRIAVQQTLPLDQVKRAHEHMENDHVRGKVVLTMSDST